MNLRRCFCCLLACVVICSGLFSVSVSAAEVDGSTVITSWAKDGEYVEFADTIVYEGMFSGDLFIEIDIFPSAPIEKDTVFNVDVTFTSGTADNWSIAYLAMYGSDNKLIDSTQDVTISSGSITAQDVQATKDVHMLKMLVKPGTVLWEVSGSGGGSGATDPTEPEVTTPPVSFTINGRTYYADSEQKWTDWINTAYNTDGIKKGTSSITSANGYGLQLNGSYLSTYDSIVNGGVYTYSGVTFLGYNRLYLPDIDTVWSDKQAYPYAFICAQSNTYLYISDSAGYYNGSYMVRGNILEYRRNSNSWDYVRSYGSIALNKLHWASHDILSDTDGSVMFEGDPNFTLNSGGSSGSGSGDTSDTPQVMISSFDFSITSVSIGEETEQGLLSGIVGWIKNIYNSIVNLPEKFAEAIKGFFESVVNAIKALGDYLLDGIKNLFVPDATDMVNNQDKWEALLEERFGAVYESTSIIDDWANAFSYSGNQSTIVLPTITVNLAGAPFSFGGWTVELIPAGFAPVIDTLKLITNIACTFLFVNGMKKRLESVIK